MREAKELAVRAADTDTKIVSGMEGLLEIAVMEGYEILVTAVVGMIGIRPTMAAIEAGKDIALANKRRPLVTAGHLIIPLVKEKSPSSPGGQRTQRDLPVLKRGARE